MVDFFKEKYGLEDDKILLGVVKEADTDNDGVVTFKEYKKFCKVLLE